MREQNGLIEIKGKVAVTLGVGQILILCIWYNFVVIIHWDRRFAQNHFISFCQDILHFAKPKPKLREPAVVSPEVNKTDPEKYW